MGRSYFVEETVGQYLSELTTKSKPLVTGLLVGQVSVLVVFFQHLRGLCYQGFFVCFIIF